MKGMRFTESQDMSCTAHTVQLVINDAVLSQRAVADVIAALRGVLHISTTLFCLNRVCAALRGNFAHKRTI